MNSTRRGFVQTSLGGLTLVSVIGTSALETACTFGTVFSAILKYIGVGLQAFQAVVDLLVSAGVLTVGTGPAVLAIVALVKAGFADLQTAVNNYNADPSNKITLLGKISAALAALEGSIQQFWNDLQIPDGKLASLVQGLLGLIVSVLQGFAAQLPTPAPTPAMEKAAQLPKRLNVVPLKMSQKQFKQRFNDLLTEAGYPQSVIR